MHKALIANSNAVGMASLPMIEQGVRAGEFVVLPVDFPELKSHYGIVQLSGRTLSPAAELVMAHIRELDLLLARRETELLQKIFPQVKEEKGPSGASSG